MIQRRKDLLKITAEGKFACLTKYRKHMHYLDAQKLFISTLVSVASSCNS